MQHTVNTNITSANLQLSNGLTICFYTDNFYINFYYSCPDHYEVQNMKIYHLPQTIKNNHVFHLFNNGGRLISPLGGTTEKKHHQSIDQL